VAQVDLQMWAAHDPTLSQSEVLIFLDDAPDRRVRMAQLAKGVLLGSNGGTRLVERLETLGYVAGSDARAGGRSQQPLEGAPSQGRNRRGRRPNRRL